VRWDGVRWAVLPTPNPAGNPAQDVGTTVPGSTGQGDSEPPSNALAAVSCTSGADCTAVGNHFETFSDSTFAEHWNGEAWALETTPDPSRTTEFTAVSCASPSFCLAVGDYQSIQANIGSDATLAEVW